MSTLPARPGALLHAILATIALLALAAPALIVANAPVIRAPQRIALPPQRIVPEAELPPVEPMRLVDLPREDAVTFNATVGFSTSPNPAARPFRFAGGPEDQARAVDCLAAAVLYEAGDDAVGERAVAQVILNRLRHPAFPKTVCGVVFQGQERATGCQFTFTCDGALARRRPSEGGWQRARGIAIAALAGAVFAPVGWATHYHTDWVVPYWSSSLDKIAKVDTHIFFRWTGWWGTPPAFNRRVESNEPAIGKLAAYSDVHRLGAAFAEGDAALAEAAALTGAPAVPLATEQDSFLVTLPRGIAAEMLPTLAARACGERTYCKYLAWNDAARTPSALPLEPRQIAAMTFSYLRDRAGRYEKALWNCAQVKRPDSTQCMKVQVYMTASPPPAPVAPPPIVATRPTESLDGVRRRAGPGPAPSATPTIAPPRGAVRPAPVAGPAGRDGA